MGAPLADPPAGFDEMSVDDQIDFVNMLWDRIARKAQAVPVPEWHVRLVRERRAEMLRDKDPGIPWEQVREELRQMLAKQRR